jgi:hypothetical protein
MQGSPFLVATLLAATFVTPASAHSWYTGLRSPSGIPCCNDRDCRPVDYRLNAQTGREEIEANGGWFPVEQDKVLAYSSPDGNAHACWGNQIGKPAFLCIILPGMAQNDRSGGQSRAPGTDLASADGPWQVIAMLEATAAAPSPASGAVCSASAPAPLTR